MAIALPRDYEAPIQPLNVGAFMVWTERFALGIRVLDNEHKQLFDIINSLHDAVHGGAEQKAIGGILDALAAYAESHFEREEGYLESYGYPKFAEHKAEHRRLTGIVYGLKRQYECNPEKVVGRDVLAFVKSWLEKHILNEDLAFVPYLRGERGDVHPVRPKAGPGGASVTVSETVPADKLDLLRQCAAILRDGGYRAFALESLLTKE
jgi:hemerythrin